MPVHEKKNQYRAIHSMFLANQVTRMRDIEDLYPTKIAKDLRINHSRYINKLYKPEKFTFKHIRDLSKVLDLDMHLIVQVIVKEISYQAKVSKKKVF